MSLVEGFGQTFFWPYAPESLWKFYLPALIDSRIGKTKTSIKIYLQFKNLAPALPYVAGAILF